MQDKIERESIPDWLLYGFAIASIGGPLALVTLNFFSSSYAAGTYSLYATLLGILIFIAPLAVWYRYSKSIASSGGLYTFVEKALGRKAANVQGWIWLVSYFLYLPYTVSYITYELLPAVFSNITPYLPFVEIGMSIVIVAAMLLSIRKMLYFIFATAMLQLIIIVAIAYAMLSGGFVHSLASPGGASLLALLNGTLLISLLFVCASLPLFLGGEVKGGARSIRKALVLSFVVTAIFLVIGSVAFLNATSQQAGLDFPGFSILGSGVGAGFAYFVAAFTIISLVELIIIEYIAITRLSYVMLNLKLKKSVLIVGALFIIASIIGIVNPGAFYSYTLVAALIALYLSLLIAFVAYPFFAMKQHKLHFSDVLITVISSLIMLYGLYLAIAPYL